MGGLMDVKGVQSLAILLSVQRPAR